MQHNKARILAVAKKHHGRYRPIADELGLTYDAVKAFANRNRAEWPTLPAAQAVETLQDVKTTTTLDGLDAVSVGSNIKTVDDLLKHIKADLDVFEVVSCEATKNEVVTKDPATGKVRVTETHRVFAKLKRKIANTVDFSAAVTSIVTGLAPVRLSPAKAVANPDPSWAVFPVADTHFGKYAWSQSTHDTDYDLPIARDFFRRCTENLVTRGFALFRPEKVTIPLLGDIFHYDTPQGTTTSGTLLDRDGRIQKMLQVGADTIIEFVERVAAYGVPTEVITVPGNHDQAFTWALLRILQERFRKTPVQIDTTFYSRKYATWGSNLLGFSHGDKAKRRLPQLMALEVPTDWGAANYREIHTGHFHSLAATFTHNPRIETVDGVVVRTAPVICPPDDWHTASGFIGNTRGMEAFFYRADGGVYGSLMEPLL